MKNTRKDFLEKIVVHILNELLADAANRLILAEIISAYRNFEHEDKKSYEMSLKAKLKEVEAKLANIMKAIEAGVVNSTTAERMNVLENEKNMLNDAILAEQVENEYEMTSHHVRRYLDGFIGDAGNPEIRDKLLQILIYKIYVYPDKLVIVCFFSGDKRELKFEEMEQLFERARMHEEIMKKPMKRFCEQPPEIQELLRKMLSSLGHTYNDKLKKFEYNEKDNVFFQ